MERIPNRSLISFLAVLLASVTLAPTAAVAATDDGVVERVVVRNRQYRTEGALEVSPMVGFSVTNRMTSTTNFQLGLGYNFSETLGLEARGSYALSSLTSVADQARDSLYKFEPEKSGAVDEFEDLWRIQWSALLMPRWTPIYGKLNLATELPVHFQAYLSVGAGAVGLTQETVVYCQNNASPTGGGRPGECGNYLQEDRVTWTGAVGGGFRFFVSEMFMVRLELFDMFHPDEHRKGINRQRAEGEAPGSTPEQGTVTSAGLSNTLFFNVGASVVF